MTKEIEWDKVDTLLSVIHGAATAGPKYANVVALAETELKALVEIDPPPPEAMTPNTAPEPSLTAVEDESSDDPEGDAIERRI